MIARKDDPIWTAISAFGIPYAPFDFNSGMDLMDVDHDEAVELGVIDDDDDAPEPQDRDFNDDLAAGVESLDALLEGALVKSVGAGFGIVDGLLSLLNEAGIGCLMATMPADVAKMMLDFQAKIPITTLVANEGKPCGEGFIAEGDTCRIGESGSEPKTEQTPPRKTKSPMVVAEKAAQKAFYTGKITESEMFERTPDGSIPPNDMEYVVAHGQFGNSLSKFTDNTEDYRKINQNPDSPDAKLLLTGLKKMKPYSSPKPLFRCMTFNSEAEMNDFIGKVKEPGSSIELNRTLTSFSERYDAAKNFDGGKYSVTCKLIHQTSGREISRWSKCSGESEVVLLKGTKLTSQRFAMNTDADGNKNGWIDLMEA
jgi:hypothetical protein